MTRRTRPYFYDAVREKTRFQPENQEERYVEYVREEYVPIEMEEDTYRRRNYKVRSMNFEKYAEDGNRFINEVANELGTNNRDKAARITRAVLHAVRDRLPANDSVEFAQGLPMALKAVYFDQYDISSTPVIIRHANDFIDYIRYKDHLTADIDFAGQRDVVRGLQAVFRVLERNMDYGQVDQIKNLLHSEIIELIDPPYQRL